MTAAGMFAVAGAEALDQNKACCLLVEQALRQSGFADMRHINVGGHEQIINMPSWPFFMAQMAGDALVNILHGTARIEIASGGKLADTKSANFDFKCSIDAYGELIADLWQKGT
jgi:hypothetical protein